MASQTPSCRTADFTTIPTNDTACAIGSTGTLPSNTSSVFSTCCKSASVEQFNGACGFYCLSVDQSVAQLTACLMEQGARPADIFCNGNQTASATGKGDGNGGASKTSGSEGARPSTGAAGERRVGKMGWGVLGIMVVSVVVGAVV